MKESNLDKFNSKMNNQNLSIETSTTSEEDNDTGSSVSASSSSILFNSNSNLANKLLKSCDWLNELEELHYFPYNSCNSLTIYSYKYWKSQNKLLVSTKENNLKIIF